MAANSLMSCCGVSTAAFPSLLSSSKSRFASAVLSPALRAMLPLGSPCSLSGCQASRGGLTSMAPHLGNDFGFDPLGLATVPENFERFKESELIRCQWAMLTVPGILVPEALGIGNWVQAQEWVAKPGFQATYLGSPVPWGTLPTILAIAFFEHKRSIEKDTEKKKYPGGAFDPFGFSKDPVKFQEYKAKEIKNGRLVLLAFVGFCVQQSAYPGTGSLQNLATHLADLWHNNIGDIIFPRLISP